MSTSIRSYLTAGVAVMGAGAVALTPVQALPNHSPERAVSNLSVELAATIDPITPWVDTIKLSFSNVQKLAAFYAQQPLPLLNAVATNQATYIQELPDLGLIASQVFGNVQTLFSAPFSPGDPAGILVSDAPVTTILGAPISQQTVFALLPAILGDLYAPLEQIIDFTATPISGALLAFAGPGLASMVQLVDSVTAIFDDLKAGEIAGAINELINIPANVVNAGLNGGKYLDLTPLVGSVLPPEVKQIGLNLGGVLSVVPTKDDGVYTGGVAFDGLSAVVDYKVSELPPPNGTTVTVNDPGLSVGLAGSVIGLGQTIGTALTLPKPAPASAAAPAAAMAAAADSDTVADEPAEAIAPATAPAPEKPAPVAKAIEKVGNVIAPNKGRSVLGSANSGTDTAKTASSRGMAKSGAARSAR